MSTSIVPKVKNISLQLKEEHQFAFYNSKQCIYRSKDFNLLTHKQLDHRAPAMLTLSYWHPTSALTSMNRFYLDSFEEGEPRSGTRSSSECDASGHESIYVATFIAHNGDAIVKYYFDGEEPEHEVLVIAYEPLSLVL